MSCCVRCRYTPATHLPATGPPPALSLPDPRPECHWPCCKAQTSHTPPTHTHPPCTHLPPTGTPPHQGSLTPRSPTRWPSGTTRHVTTPCSPQCSTCSRPLNILLPTNPPASDRPPTSAYVTASPAPGVTIRPSAHRPCIDMPPPGPTCPRTPHAPASDRPPTSALAPASPGPGVTTRPAAELWPDEAKLVVGAPRAAGESRAERRLVGMTYTYQRTVSLAKHIPVHQIRFRP